MLTTSLIEVPLQHELNRVHIQHFFDRDWYQLGILSWDMV